MKKIILVSLLVLISVSGAFAVTPDYFAFELGSGAAIDTESGDVVTAKTVGFSYSFNDSFRGGFSFKDINGVDVNTINISIVPAENATLTMYTGQITDTVDTQLAFGVGLGYDFFTNTKTFFTSLGVYLDWFASNGVSGTNEFTIEDGGVISIGLKTKIGL